VRSAKRSEKLSTNDLFHIGSCTKSMTATLAAVMVEAGEVEWDSTVGELLGEHSMADGWADVTLRQLLSHRGGAPAQLPRRVMATRGELTLKARRIAVEAILNEPPGSIGEFAYSNAGYVLAGAMLEKVSNNSPWEQLIQERLFKPLGITSAGFGAPGLPGDFSQPRGHSPTTQPIEPVLFADNPTAIGPAGTVHLSLEDWMKFIALHIRGGRADDFDADNHDLLGIDPKTFSNDLHRAAEGSGETYSLGWIIAKSRIAKRNVLAHDGSNGLWYASAWASPRLNLGVVVVANQGSANSAKACHAAMEAILKAELKDNAGK
jgi:CubicO group peptidase (beta-lactamase class C family)